MTGILQIYFLISILFTIAYLWVMLRYIRTWRLLPKFELPRNFQPTTKISVLIPARNESENIGACIHSIAQQNYPKELFELIVIDDHSEDDTAAVVKKSATENLRLIFLSDYLKGKNVSAFKKAAIEYGIAVAKNDLIVTTDADCEVPPNWLQYIAAFYENNSVKFIAAPVSFHLEINFLEKFQSLDFAGMMGITGAGIHGGFMHMCNGANLAYEKKIFEKVGGFAGIDQLASGDDMLLMHKVARQFPNAIGFIKNQKVTVMTRAQPTLKRFVRQRIRWGTKSSSYTEWQVTFILAIVFFFCWNIIFAIGLGIFCGGIYWKILVIQIIIKMLIDFIFLNQMTRFFGREDLLQIFLPAQVYHVLYIVVVGTLSNFQKRYLWKGRKMQ